MRTTLIIWEKRDRGRIQELPKFFEYPLLSRERVKLRISNLADIFRASMQTTAHEKFGKRERGWAYPGTGQIF